jgi:hypothetical protein
MMIRRLCFLTMILAVACFSAPSKAQAHVHAHQPMMAKIIAPPQAQTAEPLPLDHLCLINCCASWSCCPSAIAGSAATEERLPSTVIRASFDRAQKPDKGEKPPPKPPKALV